MIVTTSIGEQVYTHLKDLIIRGELSAGEQLVQQKLADDLGVSRTPVRDAIDQLEREGFVDRVVGDRVYVAPLSTKEIDDLFNVRAALEPLAFQEAVHRLSHSVYDELHRLVEAQAAATCTQDLPAILDGGYEFHQTIIRHADNVVLQEMLGVVFGRLERYRRHAVNAGQVQQESLSAHQHILATLQSGDTDGAIAHLAAHLETLRDHFKASLASMEPSRDDDR